MSLIQANCQVSERVDQFRAELHRNRAGGAEVSERVDCSLLKHQHDMLAEMELLTSCLLFNKARINQIPSLAILKLFFPSERMLDIETLWSQ